MDQATRLVDDLGTRLLYSCLYDSETVPAAAAAPAAALPATTTAAAESDAGVETALAHLRSAGSKIRDMKAAKAPQEQLMVEVANLSTLKVKYSDLVLQHLASFDDQLAKAKASGQTKAMLKSLNTTVTELENLLPRDVSDARKKRQRGVDVNETEVGRKQARIDALNRQSDGRLWSDILRTQRKIHNLLECEGSGDTFRYFRRCAGSPLSSGGSSSGCGSGGGDRLQEGKTVFLTEKFDGTTMQATATGIFKRYDNFRKGDRRKHKAGEVERYRLEKVDLEDPELIFAKLALESGGHLKALHHLPEGVCVYFEVCGPRIGARFGHLKDEKEQAGSSSFIRVFDSSIEGESDFQPFPATAQLCADHGLPCVPFFKATLNLDSICAELRKALEGKRKYTGVDGDLEGYVVRSWSDGKSGSDQVAKIRADDMPQIR